LTFNPINYNLSLYLYLQEEIMLKNHKSKILMALAIITCLSVCIILLNCFSSATDAAGAAAGETCIYTYYCTKHSVNMETCCTDGTACRYKAGSQSYWCAAGNSCSSAASQMATYCIGKGGCSEDELDAKVKASIDTVDQILNGQE
jgi:hypothetical protein